MPRLKVGEMRHRVTVQQPANAQDDVKQVQQTWEAVATVRAKVETLGGREVYQARQAGSLHTHRVTIWYRAAVAALGTTGRLLWVTDGNRVLNVDSLRRPDDDPQALELNCVEAG